MFDLTRKIRDFRDCESGAISVDFVVITAAICMLGFVVVSSFDETTVNIANDIGETVRSQEVNPS